MEKLKKYEHEKYVLAAIKILGQAAMTLRKDIGISQEKLSEETGVNHKSISRFERGLSDTKLTTVATILDYFNKSLNVSNKPDKNQ